MSTDEDDDRRSFSSWKFDMVDGLVFDPRIRPLVLKLIAIRILQAVNQDTGVAWISDETISDEVSSCDRKKCYKARKLLERLGWWEVEPGHGARPSQYRFKDTNLNWILDQIVVRREARREERKRRKLERKAERREVVTTPPPRGGNMTTAGKVVIRPRRPEDMVRTPHKDETDVAKSPRTNVAGLPPVHLHYLGYQEKTSQEVTRRTDARTRDRSCSFTLQPDHWMWPQRSCSTLSAKVAGLGVSM